MLRKNIKDPDLLKLYLLLQNAQKELDTIDRDFDRGFQAAIAVHDMREQGVAKKMTILRHRTAFVTSWEKLRNNVLRVIEQRIKNTQEKINLI